MEKTGGVTKEQRYIGTLCGIGAAVCYGTNPLGALNLYAEGMGTNGVLFCRFGLAWMIMSVVMALRKESIIVTWREFKVVSILGVLFIFSSLTLYQSFHLMPAGVASTILFTYPIMTVLIMLVGFGEKANLLTWSAIVLATVGVMLLYWTGEGQTLDAWGVLLVLISALTYAFYIVVVGKARLNVRSLRLTCMYFGGSP
ncbi:MAG: DMT family transporter [Bacteroidales bacterium]|nr:DMT family transporter [Bacteroidales bacterium]